MAGHQTEMVYMKLISSLVLILMAFLHPAGADSTTSLMSCDSFKLATAHGTPPERLKKYLKVQWSETMLDSPELATFTGYPGQNDRWTDISPEARSRRKGRLACWLTSLLSIPPPRA